jgi:hypothetical protein
MQIVNQSAPGLDRWWVVNFNGNLCWVSDSVGVTSGNVSVVPALAASYMIPWQHPFGHTVLVNVMNGTGDMICRLEFRRAGNIVVPFNWAKREFKDGKDKNVPVPSGHYDSVRAYNCKVTPQLTGTLKDVRIDEDHNGIDISDP